MGLNAVWMKVDGDCVARAIEEALAKLESTQVEVVLDFSAVRRIDAEALRALECLASLAGSAARVVLRGVNVDIYKVLKLTRLAPRFCFFIREPAPAEQPSRREEFHEPVAVALVARAS